MIDLAGITALPGLLGRVGTIRSSILQLGAPARLAGDPSGIRHLAAGHLASSGRLTAAQERGRAQVSRLLDASWTGEASRSFAGYWADLERRLGRLAADHQRMAAALDGIAGDCELLNRDAMALAGAIESWLKKATDAVVAQTSRPPARCSPKAWRWSPAGSVCWATWKASLPASPAA